MILLHAALNTFTMFFLSELHGIPKLVAWWTLAGLTALAALIVVRYAGARSLVRHAPNALGQRTEVG